MNIVLVGYTRDKTLAAARFCDAAFRGDFFSNRVLVCNKKDLAGASELRGWTILDGSNEFGEFSGWQEGLNFLLSLNGELQATIFLNDTINTHRRFSRFRQWALVREVFRAPPRSIVGFVDHGDNDIGDLSIAGLVLPGWVSTFCFLLGAETMRRLEYRLYDSGIIEKCIPGGPVENHFFSDLLSRDLRQQLSKWLFGGGWYRSERLSEINDAFFTRKARLICAEWLLSARCWEAGCSRRDPFERHPLAALLDRKSERLVRRLRLSNAAWTFHPQNWSSKKET